MGAGACKCSGRARHRGGRHHIEERIDQRQEHAVQVLDPLARVTPQKCLDAGIGGAPAIVEGNRGTYAGHEAQRQFEVVVYPPVAHRLAFQVQVDLAARRGAVFEDQPAHLQVGSHLGDRL
ncbi:hypothetical protein D3C80_1399050 [compost metagenome]